MCAPIVVPGLRVLEDFITAVEEEEMEAWLEGQPWHDLQHRQVQHYGFVFDYSTNQAQAPATVWPPFFKDWLLSRLGSV